MIQITSLNAGYDGRHVLHNVTFALPAGHNLAVLGPNGCGKSTLLKAVAGILPAEGEISLMGESAATMRRKELARRVALMSQTLAPAFDYSVWDTVMQGRYPHMRRSLLGGPTREDAAIAEDCMRVTGTLPLAKRPVTALSGGQLQRVFLARTLAQQPQIILLDEPTNHLDLKYQAELVEYLRDWSTDDTHTVVGVFHDINLALGLCSHGLFLKDGRQVAYGSMADVLSPTLLQEVFDMDVAAYMKQALHRWEEFA